MRFKKKTDCYLDTKTGLEWSLEGFGPVAWNNAQSGLIYPWKLPTIEELFSIVDFAKFNPATELPGMESSYYWSSNTYAYNSDCAWYVNFCNGLVDYNYKTAQYQYYVRYVRSDLQR